MKQVIIGERVLRIAAWSLVGLCIVGGGIGIKKWLEATAPVSPKSAPIKIVPSVEVMAVEIGSTPVVLNAQGEVAALRETQIAAEVGGRVIEVSDKFEPGEVFAEGDLMLRIEPADYRAALAAAQSSLASAQLALELEVANGERARRDWEKLGRGAASNLVLRKPQLTSARAAVASAEASVDKALRDLERTEIRALYPCRVVMTHVDLGATVGAGVRLVDVMSLGPVEVRLPLSLEDYGYLKKGADGEVQGKVLAKASLGGEAKSWEGEIIRSEGFVERTTRSINVIARFGAGGEGPQVGMFVEASIEGRDLEEVVVLPRLAMLNPKEVLVVTDRDQLEFREVDVVRTSQMTVIVRSGLKAGERVCVTTLNAPINGMDVEVNEGASREVDEPVGDSELNANREGGS